MIVVGSTLLQSGEGINLPEPYSAIRLGNQKKLGLVLLLLVQLGAGGCEKILGHSVVYTCLGSLASLSSFYVLGFPVGLFSEFSPVLSKGGTEKNESVPSCFPSAFICEYIF